MNLKTRVSLGVTLLAVALLGGVTLGLINFAQTSLRTAIAEQQFSLVSVVADELDARIALHQAALRAVAEAISAEAPGDRPGLKQLLRGAALSHTTFDHLLMYAADGAVVAEYPPLTGRGDARRELPPAAAETLASGRAQISAPFAGAMGTPTLTLTAPVLDARGRIAGVLAGNIDLARTRFFANLQGRRIGRSGHFFLTTPDRLTIVSRFPERVLKPNAQAGENPAYDRALAGFEGSDESMTSYGVPALMSFRTLRSTGWVLAGSLPSAEAYAPITEMRRMMLIGLALASVLIAAAVWLAMRRALAPLGKLQEQVEIMRNDPLAAYALTIRSEDEIGRLASSFRDLMGEIGRARGALVKSLSELQSVFDASPVVIGVVRERKLMRANPAFVRMFGYSLDEAIGESVAPYYESPEIFQHFGQQIYTGLEHQRVVSVELRYRRKSGELFWAIIHSARIDPADPAQGIIVVIEDIDARRRAESQSRLWGQAIEAITEGVLITDAENRIVSVNPAFTRLTGYAADEVLGATPALLKSGRQSEAFYREMWSELELADAWQGEIWNRRKDGAVFPEWLSVKAIRDAHGLLLHYVAVFTDITERKAAEERIRFMAEHDALTELPNRVLLRDRLKQAIAQAQRDNRMVAVLFVDLDRFKLVNDTLGHVVGDGLLRQVADRMREATRASDTVSRSGGDEFVIVLSALESPGDAARVCEKFMAALTLPFIVEGQEITATASIGISLFPADGSDPDHLIRAADTAMYHSKECGRNAYHFFTQEMNLRVSERMALERELRRALEHGEFTLNYQPQVSATSGDLIGMEALVRWRHPGSGLVPPSRFVPVAEDCGLIIPIGRWVLGEACRQNREWQAAGLPPLPVAVNISAMQFHDPNFVDIVRGAIAASGLEPRYLELELTESIMMTSAEQNIAVLAELRAMGIKISVDDFGTGYSSLAYLKRFPIDRLKIDQAFVRDIGVDDENAVIISAIIALAHSLGLSVIAEGVETREQFAFLWRGGCDDIQGYLFGRPQAAEVSAALIGGWDAETALADARI